MLQHLAMETRWRPHSAIRQVIGGRFVLHRRKVPCQRSQLQQCWVGVVLQQQLQTQYATFLRGHEHRGGSSVGPCLVYVSIVLHELPHNVAVAAFCSKTHWQPYRAIVPRRRRVCAIVFRQLARHILPPFFNSSTELVVICYFGNGNTPEAMFADRCSDLRCG